MERLNRQAPGTKMRFLQLLMNSRSKNTGEERRGKEETGCSYRKMSNNLAAPYTEPRVYVL